MGVGHGPILADLHPAVSFGHRAGVIVFQVRKPNAVRPRIQGLHIFDQPLLVLLERQQLIGLPVKDRGRDFGLRPSRNNGCSTLPWQYSSELSSGGCAGSSSARIAGCLARQAAPALLMWIGAGSHT